MALRSVESISPTGTNLTYFAADVAGDEFANDGISKVHVKNGSGSSINVTVNSPNACSFGITNDAHDQVVAVPAGGERWIGPFKRERFDNPQGRVQIAYSAVTSVTVAFAR